MPKPITTHHGKWDYQHIQKDVMDFKDEELYGRSPAEVRAFAKVVLAAGGVHTEILTATWDGEEYLRSGTKRVSAYRFILSLGSESEKDKDKESYVSFCREAGIIGDLQPQSDYRVIPTKRFLNVPLELQYMLSISDNEHRSDNPLNTFKEMRRLQALNEWDQIAVLWKISKTKQKTLENFGNLVEPDAFIAAFEKGDIALGTVEDISKLNKVRQKSLVILMDARYKARASGDDKSKGNILTGNDIKKVKDARTSEVLADSPLKAMNFNLPGANPDRPDGLYIFLNGDKDGLWDRLKVAREETEGRDGQLYRLVKI